MLKHLHIENYALIEHLDIDLDKGFSAITGETGAGKSILLGAIGLLTGDRADLSAIQTGKQRCTLEATFDITGYNLQTFFEENDLDYDTQCIVRRELTATGKSRAFINDTPTTVSSLKSLGQKLLDIHSQHQNLLLSSENFQLAVLDVMAGNNRKDKENLSSLEQYQTAYHAWRNAEKELADAREAADSNRENEEFLRYQYTQLQEFNPKPDEDTQLESECQMLEHAEEIRQSLSAGYRILDGDEQSAIDALRMAAQQLNGISKVYPQASGLAERIEQCNIELRDVAQELESSSEGIEYDPQRLEFVRERLNKLYSLEQKHHAGNSDELIAVMEKLRIQLDAMDCSDEHLAELEQAVSNTHARVCTLAANLTQSRTKAGKQVETTMIKSLIPLGMPNVRFQVSITPLAQPSVNGGDQITFLFSANRNTPLQDIRHVASGGEIARVMLSLKQMLTGATSLPTIIFDEIDTGVSGHIAESMARIMQQMGAAGRQVISITHLPQIAALAGSHYRVWKEDTPNATLTHISALTQEERIGEIANMLSGSTVSQAAISNARELLGI